MINDLRIMSFFSSSVLFLGKYFETIPDFGHLEHIDICFDKEIRNHLQVYD